MGKQRSLHNNYLTLPVLLFMVSNHYPFLYSHPHSWLVVALIVLAGGTIRHFLNRTEAGDPPMSVAWTVPVALVALVAAIAVTAPKRGTSAAVPEEEAVRIVQTHCASCHATKPTHEAFRGNPPPKNVVLETIADLRRNAPAVMAQAVQGKAMPLGNETGMTDAERAALGASCRSGERHGRAVARTGERAAGGCLRRGVRRYRGTHALGGRARSRARPYADHAAMVAAFQRAILAAGEGEQTALLAAHPDLAGRAAIAGELTVESAGEQKGAGLDRLTPEEFARFTTLNTAYRARFGIPFIFAVWGADKHAILAAFEARVGGTVAEERLTALAQVLRIVRFRLETQVAA